MYSLEQGYLNKYLIQRNAYFMKGLMFFLRKEQAVLFVLLVVIIMSFRGTQITDERIDWWVLTVKYKWTSSQIMQFYLIRFRPRSSIFIFHLPINFRV